MFKTQATALAATAVALAATAIALAAATLVTATATTALATLALATTSIALAATAIALAATTLVTATASAIGAAVAAAVFPAVAGAICAAAVDSTQPSVTLKSARSSTSSAAPPPPPFTASRAVGTTAWPKCPLGSAPARLLRLIRRLRVARHSQSEAQLLVAQPPPRGLDERSTSKFAQLFAFDHPGTTTSTVQ